MSGGKSIAIGVMAVAVTVVALGLIVRRVTRGTPKEPGWLGGQMEERIDRETFEVVIKTREQWQKIGHNSTHFRNPRTGKYTMTLPIICASCGAKIPGPDYGPTPGNEAAIQQAHMCPKCQKRAFPKPVGPQ